MEEAIRSAVAKAVEESAAAHIGTLTPAASPVPSSSSSTPTSRDMISRIHVKARWLIRMLTWVRATLDDAEDMDITERSIRDWLRELQEVADAAEDLLDEFPHEVLRLGFVGDGGWTAGSITELPRERKMTSEMDRLRDQRIEDIVSRFMKIKKPEQALILDYPKEQMDAESISVRRTTSSVIEESHIVGRDEELAKMKQFLLSPEAEESRGSDDMDDHVSVMAIVGMGGLGKTTLAQLAYNDAQVNKHFQLKSWVCVSEDFDVIRLTKAMLQSLNVEASGLSELETLHQKLLKRLSGEERFLLVLDDVWEAENLNIHNWNLLTAPLRNRSAGSKIIMTTRSRKVSEMVATNSTCNLGFLLDEDTLELFKLHAFEGRDPNTYQNVVAIGKEIAGRCGGVPLAAKILGGLLRTKDDEEWNKILKSEVWNATINQEDSIIPILRLSYRHLPAPLKRCFRMEHLRVLDLGGVRLYGFPESIARLKHLRYLRISDFFKELPKFVGNMYHLQTLELGGVSELPNSMPNLLNLRHLSTRDNIEYPVGIGKLSDLQTMPGFHVSPKHNHAKLGELKDMNNIRGVFAISGLENLADVNEAKKACLDKKRNISSLRLEWDARAASSSIDEEVLESLKPSVKLSNLQISGFKGPSYPSWLVDRSFSRLGNIELELCEKWISLPPLGQLPSLKSLYISKARAVEYIGSEFFSGGFPQLEELTLRYLYNWKSWRAVQKGECQKLKKLSIERCGNLESLSLINLGALEDISISGCPKLQCMTGYSLELSHLPCVQAIKIQDIYEVRLIDASHFSAAAPLKDQPCLELEDVGQREAEYMLGMRSYICRLTVRRCLNLTSLPLGNQSALEYLAITECPGLRITSISTQLWQLPSLKRIHVNGIHGAESIEVVETVTFIWCSGMCMMLVKLPTFVPRYTA
ncbi:hypothetical protein Taro_028557 [Colocasia esculenta]|uniref:Disease resistance RPP13-like protein 1 n=1 Tax=Colocasia esculenta TaxID=4460 RepID=A0A843VNH1_COLES|nr:hypothetical protein [Colocasia esculenta]